MALLLPISLFDQPLYDQPRVDLPTPKKNLATKKPAKFCTIPIRVATMPQTIVSVGSHNLGDVRLRIILQGIFVGRQLLAQAASTCFRGATNLEKDVSDEIQRKTRQVLVPSYAQKSAPWPSRDFNSEVVTHSCRGRWPSLRCERSRHYCGRGTRAGRGYRRRGEVGNRSSAAKRLR